MRTPIRTDRKVIEYEAAVRPSEYFSERYNELQSRGKTEINVKRLLSSCHVDDDPITHWMQYIDYVKERFPSDDQHLFAIYKRCVRALMNHFRYKMDQRFVRICIIYADRSEDTLGQFEHMYNMKIGVKLAMLWMSWAWVTEKNGDYHLTEIIFRKAMEKEARPMNVIEERFDQFKIRMQRSEKTSLQRVEVMDTRRKNEGEKHNKAKQKCEEETFITKVSSGHHEFTFSLPIKSKQYLSES